MSGSVSWNKTGAAQSGQAAVLMALCLFSLVVFLAMATNMGILVNDRVRMQHTADLTSYAGAFEQARNMNQMADMNQDMYDYVQQVRGVLNYGPSYVENGAPDETAIHYWRQPPCSCLDYSPKAQAYIQAAQVKLDLQAAAIQVVNKKAPVTARAAATWTAGANFLKAFVGPNHLWFFQDQAVSPTSRTELLDLDRVNETKVGYNYLRSCKCCDGCCLYPSVHVEVLNTWYYKDPNQGQVYFPSMVQGVPEKNFVDFNNTTSALFGADADSSPRASDMLYGYSAAKPYDGNLGTSNPDNGNGEEEPKSPVYPPSDDYEEYFRPTYRARVSGIHEEMGSTTRSTSMADLISNDKKHPQFKDKVEYFAH